MKPGPELDALVAKGVMGWNWQIDSPTAHLRYCTVPTKKMPDTRRLFSPSTDIVAAWEVVEKFDFLSLFKTEVDLGFMKPGQWECLLVADHVGSRKHYAVCDTAPHAICIAALKAMQSKEGLDWPVTAEGCTAGEDV